MTLVELLDQLQRLTDDGMTFHERDAVRGYTVAFTWGSQPGHPVTEVRINSDQRIVWLDTNGDAPCTCHH